MNNKTDKAPALRCDAMVRWIEWGTIIFCAIASIGVTGQYWLAFDFVGLGMWLHLKNNHIARQQREFHAKLSLPNVTGEPRAEDRL